MARRLSLGLCEASRQGCTLARPTAALLLGAMVAIAALSNLVRKGGHRAQRGWQGNRRDDCRCDSPGVRTMSTHGE